ncbi:MAG: cyanophycinase [Gemmatimonas sp.]
MSTVTLQSKRALFPGSLMLTRTFVQFALAVGLGTNLSLAAPLAAQSARGSLLVVGGGTQPDALVEEFVRLAGGPGKARIVVMAMASESGERSGESKAADLRKRGATARNLWFSREQADRDSLVRLLDSATGIWFGGGDQNKLAAVIRGTKMERAIRSRWENGAVVGGTSAGAAVLSTPMITGDELGTRRDTSEAWTRIERGSVKVDSGFSFITNAVIDQHFVRRKRTNRLLSLVLATPPHLGAGIDEGTALIVEPSGRWRIMGVSVVIVYDARRAERTTTGVLGARDIRMHVLTNGMTFDPTK